MKPETHASGTVGKALSVLDHVASFKRPVRFSELLESSPYPKGTLYRIVQNLVSERMLAYDTDRHAYSLGLRLVGLAHGAWKQSSLAPIARDYIDDLSRKIDHTVHLAQLESGQVLFVDKRRTSSFETLAQAGEIAPAFCTGVGKAILAFLPENKRARALAQQAFIKYTPSTHSGLDTLLVELEDIRNDGIAFDREEHERGIISVAAPILTPGKRVIGALSIATTTSLYSLADLEKLRPELLETAENIGQAAENWQFPT